MADPLTIATVAGIGLNAIGSLGGDKMSKDQLREHARQFNEQLNWQQQFGNAQNEFDRTKLLNDFQRQIEGAGTRDKALYMINQRLGMVPQSFQPRDMMNPQSAGATNPQQGGVDPAKLQGAMASYRAPGFYDGTYSIGSGGVNPLAYAEIMAQLGYTGNFARPQVGNLQDMPSVASGSQVRGGYGQSPAPVRPGVSGVPPQGATVNPPGTTPWGSPANGPGWGPTYQGQSDAQGLPVGSGPAPTTMQEYMDRLRARVQAPAAPAGPLMDPGMRRTPLPIGGRAF